MPVSSSSGDFPAVSTAKFGGGGLPRSYQHNEAKFSKVKIDPPEPVAGPFLSWARDAQLTMSSLRFDRRRSQGRIDGSIWRLREDEEDEEEEERENQKKRPKMGTADSGESEESDGVDGSEEEEESEKALDSDESEYSSDSEEEDSEVDETEDTTDSDEPEDGEEEEGGEQEIKGKPPVGCRRSKRLRKVAACSEEE